MNNKKQTPIVSLHGASRNHNYGDVLLMAIYKNWIEEIGGEVVLDMANDYYGRYLNVQSHLPISKAVNKANFIVYGGGGYFGEPRNPSLRWRVKFVLHHMMPGILSRLKGKPYGFFGIGFGPLDNLFIRKIGMFVINGARIVSVRDEESKQYLIKYGYKGKIHVNPDSALSLADINSKYYVSKQINKAQKRVVFHIPLDPGKDFEMIRPALVDFLTRIKQIQGNFDFHFLVDHGLGKHCYQYLFFDQLRKDLDVNWSIKEYISPEDTLQFLSTCDSVITTKLHVAITSYALGVRPIGISKHPKTQRFFKQIGLSNLQFDLYDLLDSKKSLELQSIIERTDKISINSLLIENALNNKKLLKELLQS
ncbi:polysaccharide pyruvyl transferase family protein [Sphingobacterium litopenaei]|uniref:Polysaccharide pyruvyl transferase family protein n=1 Tax=Sphingobacterium litopenaei TaxID=2763500 RepID=A0ABR7YEM7_9SPHI|nr:polysaccharide pyruvyl transferase family protein [Sphingobacterium litopenaei]MBD1429767.1 polysaccharide pyruvyl transferase family protein [Sphingobacterium litopenaei]